MLWTNQVGFNVELGGYFSIKRNATSIPGDTWLDVEEVAPYCKAILEVFRYSICCFLSSFPSLTHGVSFP